MQFNKNYYVNSDGNLAEVPNVSIMVDAITDVPDNCEPGTVAYTPGFANMWQLDTAGTWQAIIEEEE